MASVAATPLPLKKKRTYLHMQQLNSSMSTSSPANKPSPVALVEAVAGGEATLDDVDTTDDDEDEDESESMVSMFTEALVLQDAFAPLVAPFCPSVVVLVDLPLTGAAVAVVRGFVADDLATGAAVAGLALAPLGAILLFLAGFEAATALVSLLPVDSFDASLLSFFFK